MGLQRKLKQVPCADCIERASKAYVQAEATPPGLCSSCRSTRTRIGVPKSKKPSTGHQSLALGLRTLGGNKATSDLGQAARRKTITTDQQAQNIIKTLTTEIFSISQLVDQTLRQRSQRPGLCKLPSGIKHPLVLNSMPSTTSPQQQPSQKIFALFKPSRKEAHNTVFLSSASIGSNLWTSQWLKATPTCESQGGRKGW